jgi:uncharacterized protein
MSMFGPATARPAELAAPRPIGAGERIMSIDVLRGFALCGILVMNIPWFARSSAAFFNPTLGGGFEGADYWTWLISHLFFDMKMMTIFSMLFGAGMLVMTSRAEAAGRSAAGIYYRRLVWLLLFGLLHAYFIWSGDILYTYALCGMLLYPLRRLRPVTLIVLGLALLFIGNLMTMGMGWFFASARSAAEVAQAAIDAGQSPTEFQRAMLDAWPQMKQGFIPSAERVAEETAAHTGGYWKLFIFRVPETIMMQTSLFITMLMWRAAGVMLLGMALMKMDVFTARRSTKFYAGLMAAGYLAGLPMVGAGAWFMQEQDFDFIALFKYGWTYNYVGSIFVALGHIGLVMLVCKLGLLQWLTKGLAAIGRMALTNYLMHSVICATLFFGWGFGIWGELSRFETMGVVLAILAFQFIFSQLWLSAFRFGPTEWLWRTLTYWRVQPMRRAEAQHGAMSSAG